MIEGQTVTLTTENASSDFMQNLNGTEATILVDNGYGEYIVGLEDGSRMTAFVSELCAVV